MKKINLKTLVLKEGKYYVAQCLNIDVSSFGKTKRDALANLTEALELYFEETKGLRSKLVKVERSEILTMSFRYA